MDEATAPQSAPEPQSVAQEPSWAPVPGGFWLRGGAYMIDSLVVSVAGTLAFFVAPAPVQTAGRILTAVLYFTVVPVLWNGQTLGKSAAGLAILREDGQPLNHLTSFLRYIGYLLSLLPLGLGFLAAAFTPNKRALHDYVAGTRVLQIEEIGLARRVCVIGFAVLLPFVAVLGIAAAIAIPQFSRLQARAKEGEVKARLVSLRSAAMIYEGDHNGAYPPDLSQLPQARPSPGLSQHPAASGVEVYGAEVCADVKDSAALNPAKLRDTGKWGYVADPKAPCYGRVFLDCTHADAQGKPWSSF